MNAVIEVDALHVSYDGHVAVNGATFAVAPGESVALLGRNGAGKSSIIRSLLGLITPRSGDVKICGIDPPARRRGMAEVGYVPQSSGLIELLTVEENIARAAAMHLEKSRVAGATRCVIDKFGLSELVSRRSGRLSGGQRRLTQVAMALVHDPMVIILDEPTNALDAEAQEQIATAVLEARGRGATILLSTHRMDEVRGMTDRAVVLDRGRVVDCCASERLDRKAEAVRVQRLDGSLPDIVSWRRIGPDVVEADSPLSIAALAELVDALPSEATISVTPISEVGLLIRILRDAGLRRLS